MRAHTTRFREVERLGFETLASIEGRTIYLAAAPELMEVQRRAQRGRWMAHPALQLSGASPVARGLRGHLDRLLSIGPDLQHHWTQVEDD